MLIQALSGASVIFGLYLLINFLFLSDSPVVITKQNYHIGCYSTDNVLNHSQAISNLINQIQVKSRQNTQLNMYKSKVFNPHFDKDVNKVAQNFENYIKAYYISRGSTDEEIHFYNSLQLAKIQYKQCARSLTLNQSLCQSAWSQYVQAREEIDKVKEEITELIETKQKNENGLSKVLLDSTVWDEGKEKNLSLKIKQLQQKVDDGEKHIVNVRSSRTKIKAEIVSYDSELLQLRSILNQCISNQQLIWYCNEISQQVHRLQELAPKLQKKDIQKRIAKKMLIVSGLQANIKNAKRLREFDQASKQQIELAHQKRQLKLLEFQFQNFDTQVESRCAMCSESRIQELKKNISILQANKLSQQKTLVETETEIINKQISLGEIRKQAQNARIQKQDVISAQFCFEDKCKQEQKKLFIEKVQNLDELKRQILDKQVEVNFLQQSFNAKYVNVQGFLTEIDKVIDCYRKKQYYQQLKKKKPIQKEPNGKMINSRQIIIQQLTGFEL